MGRLAAVVLGATACGLLGLLGGVLVLASTVSNQGAQIAQLRSQLTQAEHANQQAQAGFAAERAAFSQAEARIGGTHRDLITCADWQNLVLPVSGTDSLNGQILASAGPASLPSHCINQ